MTDQKHRSCNRHEDCDAADLRVKAAWERDGKRPDDYRRWGADHCHDDCCEDCFGS